LDKVREGLERLFVGAGAILVVEGWIMEIEANEALNQPAYKDTPIPKEATPAAHLFWDLKALMELFTLSIPLDVLLHTTLIVLNIIL
jgi:hypothetical protein